MILLSKVAAFIGGMGKSLLTIYGLINRLKMD